MRDKVGGSWGCSGASQSLASSPTASEEESRALRPAQPLPSTQTFAFQTPIRRCHHPSPAGFAFNAALASLPASHIHTSSVRSIWPPLPKCSGHLPLGLLFLTLGKRAHGGFSQAWRALPLPGAASAWCGSAGRRPADERWRPRSFPTALRTGLLCCANTKPSRACATHTWPSYRPPTSAPGTWSSSWSCARDPSCSPAWRRGEAWPGCGAPGGTLHTPGRGGAQGDKLTPTHAPPGPVSTDQPKRGAKQSREALLPSPQKGLGPRPPAAVDGAEPPSPCAPRASYSESEVKDYLWQMLSAAQYLHAQSILHLDLRSENMIVTEYNLLKVVDLGNAQSLAQERVLPSERFKDYVETMGALGADANLTWGEGWARRKRPPPGPASLPIALRTPSLSPVRSPVSTPAPELLDGQGAVPQTDIWAIGVTAFIM